MPRLSKKTVIIAALAVLLIGVVVPPMISLGAFRKQIQSSISSAVGRPVSIGDVSLRIFPQPGFDLQNVIIEDDPAFGAEPVIRAEAVTASLRLSSIWRLRPEIASLSLKYPSLNLVRAEDGRWNIESLLQRTSQSPTAPTTKTSPESRSRFPYIESDNGRINLKLGNEKKVFALLDADFALWQESESEFRIRVEARPVRMDANLSDTGILKLSGSFQRAQRMIDMPVQLRVSWEQAQLGQLTWLMYGRDRGWRGEFELSTVLSGTPGALNVTAEATVDGFRRYDILTTDSYRLAIRCTGTFSSATDELSDTNCQLPTGGNGLVALKGTVRGILRPRAYDLSLLIDRVPTQALVQFAQRAKKDLAADLLATGQVDATFEGRKEGIGKASQWNGGGTTSGVVLTSKMLERELSLGNVQFSLQQASATTPVRVPQPSAKRRLGGESPGQRAPSVPVQTVRKLAVTPFIVNLGGASPATVDLWLAPEGYNVTAKGEADVTRLLQVARVLGIPVPDANTEGRARLDVAIAGAWTGYAAPKPTGYIQLREVRAEFKGANSPLQIAGADLRLEEDAFSLQNLSASFAGVKMNFTGRLSMPRQCPSIEACPVTFDLRADQISVDALNELFNPNTVKRPWYRILPSRQPIPILTRVRGQGTLSAGRVSLGTLSATSMVARASIANSVLELSDLRADVLGGKHLGAWRADFAQSQPAYSGSGRIASLPLATVSTAMRSKWASGTVDLDYDVVMSGAAAGQLLASADGKMRFAWQNGELRHVTLGNETLRFSRFAGSAALKNGAFSISESKMHTPRGILEVSGTASLSRQLDLRLNGSARSVAITGTVENPKVRIAETETPPPAESDLARAGIASNQ